VFVELRHLFWVLNQLNCLFELLEFIMF